MTFPVAGGVGCWGEAVTCDDMVTLGWRRWKLAKMLGTNNRVREIIPESGASLRASALLDHVEGKKPAATQVADAADH